MKKFVARGGKKDDGRIRTRINVRRKRKCIEEPRGQTDKDDETYLKKLRKRRGK